MSLPSGLVVAMSSDALFDHGGNWTKCPDGHFWYWLPAPEIGSPPFDLLPASAIMQIAAHAPVPKDRDECKRFIRIVEMRPDGEFGWRGEWLSTFPLYTKLTTQDIATWNDYMASPEATRFLDETIAECTRLSEVSRNAQGYALLSHTQHQHNENWSEDDEKWFREFRRLYKAQGGTKYYKLLGDHPVKGGPVSLGYGPFGPIVKHNDVTASTPRGKLPESITLSEAIALLDARLKT